MFVTNVNKVERNETMPGVSLHWLLSKEVGTPHFEMRYIEIEPGCNTQGNPHEFEHEIYVLHGKGRIEGMDQTVSIAPGDAILVSPGEKHRFFSIGDEPLKIICIIPNGAEDLMKNRSFFIKPDE
jgi:quercetin dioxygenase-like cupin family protein